MTNEVLQKTASDEQNVSSSNGLEPSLRFTGFYENWHEKYIKDVADVIGGGTPDTTKLEYWNGNIQWFTPTEIGHNKYVNKSKRTITEKGLKNSSAKLLPPKTILLTSRATIGECSIIEKECATNQGFQSLVPNSLINNEFCYYLINTKKKELLRKASGSTFLEISNSEIKQIKCKFPSLLEQQKIADFLFLVDRRIEKQRQLVESLKKYKRGLLSAIFDHKLRFKDENGNDYPEWDNFVLDNLGSFYNGLSGKNKDDFGTGNSEYITYMNVFKNTIANETICERVNILPNEHQNIVNFGDLLFTQSSETMEEVGFCSVWNSHKKVFLNSFCFGLHFNNSKFAYPQFMAHYMRSYKIRLLIMRESQGATRINLSSERLKKIELSLPPYKEQKIIAHFIERYDNTIQNEEKKLEMFNNLKQGLLQQMFI